MYGLGMKPIRRRRELESMTAEADGYKQAVGADSVEDRIRIRRHVVGTCPSPSRLRILHPRKSFREPGTQVADRCRRDRLREGVTQHRLPRFRVHVAGQGVLLPFGPRVRVSVEIEMDSGRWAKVDGSSQDCDFAA